MSIRWTLALVLFAATAAAAQDFANDTSESGSRRWTLHVDNDFFAAGHRDQDYTAGFAFTLAGGDARRFRFSPSRLLDFADRTAGFATARRGATFEDEALELGLVMFTPQDLSASQALPDDRPYANLVYVASSKLALDEPRGAAYQSSLAIGFLGLPLAEQVHRGIHELVGSAVPRGYQHQIADGGEPTFMYAASRYRRLASGELRGQPYSLRVGVGASVGYITEANVEIAFRTNAPWWESSSAAADYSGHPQIVGPPPAVSDHPRVQFEAGAKLHTRVYNSFLQGQFRDSDVTYGSAELERVLVDVWLAATTVLGNGLSVTYAVHRQTGEIESGRGSHDFTWASIGFAQRF